MKAIAHIRTGFSEKFGIPRQSSLTPSTRGVVVFEPEFRRPEALRGLEGFDWIWLIWDFSENGSSCREDQDGLSWQATVRPPRLGGNKRMGVFATRSTFRPNPLGLSSVRLVRIIEQSPDGPLLEVAGADLMDGTPIYDIKPYIPYSDCHPDASCGWLEQVREKKFRVVWDTEATARLANAATPLANAATPLATLEREDAGPRDADATARLANAATPLATLRAEVEEILACDPRPSYLEDPERVYGITYGGYNIRFRVDDALGEIRVVEISGPVR